jgi:phage FluMu protein Com
MPQICSNCLYINDGKFKSIKGSLLGGVFLIGGSIVIFNVLLFNVPYFSLIISLIATFYGILSLRNYFNIGKKSCPKCKHKTMLLTYEPEAQKLIEEHGFMVKDEKSKFCTNCHYKGESRKIQSLKYSLLLVFAGIVSLPVSLSLNWVGLIGSFLMIGVGIYGALTNFRKPDTCPSCKHIPMIPIESDEAKSLIKQDQPTSPNLSPEHSTSPSHSS